MAIFFTSDQHYWHGNIIRYCNRPFTRHLEYLLLHNPDVSKAARTDAILKDVSEMNEALVRKHNEVVNPGDTVYHLGDFSLAFRPVELYIPRLNGEHYLITGNHDFCSPLHKKGRKQPEVWKQKYLDNGFKTVQDSLELNIGDQKVLLCHLPYSGKNEEVNDSGYEERYSEDRPIDVGITLLHGHVHQHWKTKRSSLNTLMINCGVDVWDYAPVSSETILELIKDSLLTS